MSPYEVDPEARCQEEDATVACVACEHLANVLEVDRSGVCYACRDEQAREQGRFQRHDTHREAEMDLAA